MMQARAGQSMFKPRGSQTLSTASVIETTLCGHEGTARERNCQMLKLTFLSVLPGFILMITNAISLDTSVTTLRSNQHVKENVKFSVDLGLIIHNCQRERGTTALYVSSDGDPFLKPRLLTMYKNTDAAISALSRWVSLDHLTHFHSKSNFHVFIESFREELDPKNISIREAMDFYTDNNQVFIDLIGNSINVEMSVTFWTDIVAYQMLIVSKEQAGIERALGSTYFARGEFPLEDLHWYREKNILGASVMEQCKLYSTFAREQFEIMYTNTKLSKELVKMREQIGANVKVTPSVVNGTIWFDNMTQYIDILKTVQDRLALRIVQLTADVSSDLEDKMVVSVVELVIAIILLPIIMFLVRNIVIKIQTFSIELKDKTNELEQERKRTEELLYQLLPMTVARKLMEEGHALPEAYHSVTIMFSDVVGFTRISSRSSPMQVVSMLNTLYMTIDGRLENFDVYKVETIGDGYMVASGLPTRNGDRHVEEVAKLSLDLLKAIERMEVAHLKEEKLKLRIGFNTGPCVAGVVGLKMPRYCVFGDTVNVASRMESTGLPLKVQMTEESAFKLRKQEGYALSERGYMEIKGKGEMRTFWLDGYDRLSVHKISGSLNTPPVMTSDVTESGDTGTIVHVKECV